MRILCDSDYVGLAGKRNKCFFTSETCTAEIVVMFDDELFQVLKPYIAARIQPIQVLHFLLFLRKLSSFNYSKDQKICIETQ